MNTNKIDLEQKDFIIISTADGEGWQSQYDTSVMVLTEQGLSDVVDGGLKINQLDGYDIVAEVSIADLIKSHNEMMGIKAKAKGYQNKVDGAATMLIKDEMITGEHSNLQVREIIFDHYPDEEDIDFRADVEVSVDVIFDNQKAA